MTVASETSRNDYVGNGATDTYDYTFRIFEETDLLVTQVDLAGVEDPLTYLTDYTVTGAGSFSGGTVVLAAGNLTSGYGLTIRFRSTLTQQTDIRNQSGFFPEVIEDALDRLTKLDQQQQDEIDRTIKLPETETGTMTLPTITERASAFLAFDASGEPIASSGAGSAPVSTFMATVVDDSTAGEAIETLRGGLTAETVPADDDEILFRDTSATAGKRMTLRNAMKIITALATETAPDVLDELALYDVSASTADKITLANLLKVVNGLTEDTAPDRTADYLLSYDTSASAAKKIKLETVIRQEAVRQTVAAGSVDSNGQANFLNAGTGLAVDMDATTTPVVATFAAGEDALGPVNYRTRFAADQADYFSGLAASNLSFLMLERDSATGAISAYDTLVPPQYAPAFDKTKQFLLPFAGADASTTITDTYGNAWTVGGNAQIDTGIQVDGENTLLLDGTGDYINTTGPTTFPANGWTIEGKVRPSALPGVGVDAVLVNATNAGAYGLLFTILNTAGTYYFKVYASSDGTSWNIASAVSVALPTQPVVGTTYHFAIEWDKVAGKLYTYWNGVKVNDTAMTANLCSFTNLRFGANMSGTDALAASLAGLRMSPCARYPAGTTFTAPTLPFAADAEWFDLSEFKWKYGSPTSWAEKQRVCIGEVTTNATVPTSVVTYALRGKYVSPSAAPPAAGAATSISHHIGIEKPVVSLKYQCINTDAGYAFGDELEGILGHDGANISIQSVTSTRLTAGFAVPGSGGRVPNKSTGAFATATVGKWVYQLRASRGW